MIKPTLVILAAGLGSRYGGMKQIDGVGSHGEPIIDFSVYDAWKTGFGKIVLIIKPEHETAFRRILTDEIEPHIPVEFVFQRLDDLPDGFTVPEGRIKPWGTLHALLACRNTVKEPFAIINADDFYGRGSFELMYHYLSENITDDHYAMAGYRCLNTLTENGTVSRGICRADEKGRLTAIRECRKVRKKDGHAVCELDGKETVLPDDMIVSMNFWGFTPKIFAESERIFRDFLTSHRTEDALQSEALIPSAVGQLIAEKKCDVKILMSSEQWYGITYHEDKPEVVRAIARMKADGTYPDELWS